MHIDGLAIGVELDGIAAIGIFGALHAAHLACAFVRLVDDLNALPNLKD